MMMTHDDHQHRRRRRLGPIIFAIDHPHMGSSCPQAPSFVLMLVLILFSLAQAIIQVSATLSTGTWTSLAALA